MSKTNFILCEWQLSDALTTEAVKQFTSYLFVNHNFIKIYASVFDFNTASQKVLQKAGFEREAVLKQAAVKNDKVIDLHYYSLFK
ncbi:MAG: GNAT family N-acetyltransferase [Dysgonamonadaceae bacterium]|jgi:RimJ/RimL family protein N-acetyltransferase|nr:GNAT family N-acetyltransferase [Dysgonamonadaceae bacterium]